MKKISISLFLLFFLTNWSSAQDQSDESTSTQITIENGKKTTITTLRKDGKIIKEDTKIEDYDPQTMGGNNFFFNFEDFGGFGNIKGFDGIAARNKNVKLGIVMRETDDKSGVIVKKVMPGSSADMAGIRSDDIIIQFNNTKVEKSDDIISCMKDKNPEDIVKIQILRNSKLSQLDVRLKGEDDNEDLGLDFFKNLRKPKKEKGEKDIDQEKYEDYDFGYDDLFNGNPFFDGNSIEKLYEDFGAKGKKDSDKGFGDHLLSEDEYRTGQSERPNIGIFIEDKGDKVIISEVVKDSPAYKAKLQSGDIIKKIDGRDVRDYEDVKYFIKKSGNTVKVDYERKGKISTTQINIVHQF